MSGQVLGSKDVNAPLAEQAQSDNGKNPKSMDFHRQVFQSKINEPASQSYVSPSDIMSPCTAKINALRTKQVSKAKPKSLFAQASAKKLNADNVLGAVPAKP